MDTTPAIMILTPILLPAAQAVGMDGVQFGIMMVVNLAIGFVTPPIGVNLFVASSLSDVPVMQLAAKAAPMIVLFFLVLILLIFVPPLSLCLLHAVRMARKREPASAAGEKILWQCFWKNCCCHFGICCTGIRRRAC